MSVVYYDNQGMQDLILYLSHTYVDIQDFVNCLTSQMSDLGKYCNGVKYNYLINEFNNYIKKINSYLNYIYKSTSFAYSIKEKFWNAELLKPVKPYVVMNSDKAVSAETIDSSKSDFRASDTEKMKDIANTINSFTYTYKNENYEIDKKTIRYAELNEIKLNMNKIKECCTKIKENIYNYITNFAEAVDTAEKNNSI